MYLKTSLTLFCLIFFSFSIIASHDIINEEDFTPGLTSITEEYNAKAFKSELRFEKKQLRMEKRMAWLTRVIEKKLEKRFTKKAKKKQISGIDDPVDKWFWFWVITWGGAILFLIFAGALGGGFFMGFAGSVFALLSTLLWVAGTISLVLWLLKRFG